MRLRLGSANRSQVRPKCRINFTLGCFLVATHRRLWVAPLQEEMLNLLTTSWLEVYQKAHAIHLLRLQGACAAYRRAGSQPGLCRTSASTLLTGKDRSFGVYCVQRIF